MNYGDCGNEKPGYGRREMIRRVRLGNIRKLLRDRCGPVLPNDDAGREYLYELLLAIAAGPHAEIKMRNAAEVWAPWMAPDEAKPLIDDINRTPIWRRMRRLGRLANGLTWAPEKGSD